MVLCFFFFAEASHRNSEQKDKNPKVLRDSYYIVRGVTSDRWSRGTRALGTRMVPELKGGVT